MAVSVRNSGVLQSKEQARAFCRSCLQTHRLPANAALAMRSIEGAGTRNSFGNERCPCGQTKLPSAMRRNPKNHTADRCIETMQSHHHSHARDAPVDQRRIDVSEGDLRVIAEHGYEGAASADRGVPIPGYQLVHQRHRCRRGYIPSPKCRTAARISA
jgi:hypothetical protein